jgi:hypothetical protein
MQALSNDKKTASPIFENQGLGILINWKLWIIFFDNLQHFKKRSIEYVGMKIRKPLVAIEFFLFT